MAKGSETLLVTQILSALNHLPNTAAIKLHGSIYSRVGEPDIIGCSEGTFFAIEVKANKNRPTNIQYRRLKQWRKAGANVGVAYSVKDAIDILAGKHNDVFEV